MTLRKCNAILGLIATLLILDHAVFYAMWMLSGGSIPVSSEMAPRILASVVIVHALCTAVVLMKDRKGTRGTRCRMYVKPNLKTLIQRISGAAMLVMLVLHGVGAANQFQPKLLHAVLHPVFFAAVLAHTAISVSRSLITLGVGNAKVIRWVDILMAVICTAAFLVSAVGLYLYMGVAE